MSAAAPDTTFRFCTIPAEVGTDPPAEVGTDPPAEVGTRPAGRGRDRPGYAARSATGKYRTTPLRGLWQHAPYFHDGSAPDFLAVVNHYNQLFSLNLSEAQKADLVEFLKSL